MTEKNCEWEWCRNYAAIGSDDKNCTWRQQQIKQLINILELSNNYVYQCNNDS